MNLLGLRREWQKAKDTEMQAESVFDAARTARRSAERAYAEALMMAAYGLKAGDIIEFKKMMLRGWRRGSKVVTRRMKITRFTNVSDDPDDIWLEGPTILLNGSPGRSPTTIYGLKGTEWKKVEVSE